MSFRKEIGMKKLLFPIVLCLLVSCAAPAMPAPTNNVTSPTATPLVSTAANTAEPTLTSLPPNMVSYYRIRVEYATTSDWSTLELTTPDHVLALRTMQVNGEPTGYEAGIRQLSLNQPLWKAGYPVSLIVDYAIAPEAIEQGLQFRMQKGDVGSGMLDVYMLADGTLELILSGKYSGVVPNSSGLNPKLFTVDLSPLAETPPLVANLSSPARQKMLWAFF